MNFDLAGKVIVVTGGAGRIGSAFVRAIAQQGAVAVIADTNDHAAGMLAEEIVSQPGQRAEFHGVDITSKESAAQLITTLHGKFGRIDALVNNAYPRNDRYGRKFEDVAYEDFCENVSTHLGGYFLMAQQFGLFFRRQGYGNIVNMASIYGVISPRFEVYDGMPMTMPVEYAAIKSGIIHLTKYLAKYFKGNHIRVNCISPGGILAGQPDEFLSRYNSFALSKGMLDSSDITGTLLFLLSDHSTYINGQNIIVDDGWTL